MAVPAQAGKDAEKGLPELGRELVDLTVTYAKQETIGPLRHAGRTIGNGVKGAAIASVGLLLLVLGTLRVVQVEARLRGLWSFVPYVAALVVAGLVAFVSVKKIQGSGKERRDG